MKKTIILQATIILLALGACQSSSTKSEQQVSTDSTTTQNANTSQTFNLDTTKLKSGDTFYQCEMNPEVLSDRKGNCPKCGMELSEMKKQ
jgi:hypothetical protein